MYSISGLLNSKWGQTALLSVFGCAVTTVALALFQQLVPHAFHALGGPILYVVPEASGGLCLVTTLGYLMRGGQRQEKPHHKPIEDHERPRAPTYVSKEERMRPGTQRTINIDQFLQIAASDDKTLFCEQAGLLYNKYQKVKNECTDLDTTAKALGIERGQLIKLFDHFGLPELSQNDSGCISAFFALLPGVYTRNLYMRSLDYYCQYNHPLWPAHLKLGENPLQVGEFAQFLHIRIEELIGLLNRIGIENKHGTSWLSKGELIAFKNACNESEALTDKQPQMWKVANFFCCSTQNPRDWTRDEQMALKYLEWPGID